MGKQMFVDPSEPLIPTTIFNVPPTHPGLAKLGIRPEDVIGPGRGLTEDEVQSRLAELARKDAAIRGTGKK